VTTEQKLSLALNQLRQNGNAIACLAAALKILPDGTLSDKVDVASALTLIQVEFRETQRVLTQVANAQTVTTAAGPANALDNPPIDFSLRVGGGPTS
jgi:hypothetical protein